MASPALAQDITTGLVGHWKLDETTGTTAADSIGGNHGTVGGTNFSTNSIAAKLSTGLNFDGNGDNIDMGNPAALMPTEISVCAWARRNGLGNGDTWQLIASKHVYNSGGYSLTFEPETTGVWWRVQASGSGNDYVLSHDLNTTQWHHYCGTFDGSITSLYVNGSLVGSMAGSMDSTAANFRVGEDVAGQGDLEGDIDDLRVYNRALEPVDIMELSQRTPGAIRYNETSEALQYFNSDEWVHAGIGSYVPNSVDFDGTNDILSTPAATLGISDSNQITSSFWFRRHLATGGDMSFQYNGSASRFSTYIEGSCDCLVIAGKNSGGTQILQMVGPAFTDTDWHHVMFSLDLTDPAGTSCTQCHLYVDGVDASPTINTFTSGPLDLDDNTIEIGGAGGSPELDADVADYWFDTGTYIDLSDADNRAKFISANGMPMYLGQDGSLATGTSPDIFLSGATENWHTNKGTGGGFTENGALTDSTVPITTADSTFSILDTFDPTNIAGIDSLGTLLAAVNSSNHVFTLFDISDPGNITVLDTVSLGAGNPVSVAINSDARYAFVMSSTGDSFRVINITNPSDISDTGISITGTFLGGGDIDVIGDTAYTAASIDDDFSIVDISNPLAPSVTGYISDGTQLNGAVSLDVIDNYAYVASINSNSISVIDISNPALPSIVGHLSDGTNLPSARAVQVTDDGNYAFVALDDGTGGFSVVDVSNKAAPAFIARYTNTATGVNDLYLDRRRNRLILAGGDNDTLEVWDVSDPENPAFLNFRTDTGAYDSPYSLTSPDNENFYISSTAGTDHLTSFRFDDCANPTGKQGSIIYNTDFKVMQYCNGVDWVAMGPVGGTGGSGCADPVGAAGDLMYNTDYETLQYCNAEDWVGVGYNRPYIPTNGLIHHWPLDETSGSTLYDSVGSADCTVTGTMNSVPGQLGTALELQGGADCGDIADIKNLGAVTISGWFRRLGPGDIAGAGKEVTDGAGLLGIYVWDDGYTYGAVGDSNAAVWEQAYGDDGDTLGMRHLTMVFDGSKTGNANRLKSFINGQQVITSFYGTIPATTSSVVRDFIIGNDAIIDDVRIYNRALSNKEVEYLYLATDTDTCTGGGYEEGGSCWYMGALGQSCDNICAVHGLSYDPATLTYAGSAGTDAQCRDVWDALYPYFDLGGTPTQMDCGPAGVGCIITDEPARERCYTPTTNSSDSAGDSWRACACQ